MKTNTEGKQPKAGSQIIELEQAATDSKLAKEPTSKSETVVLKQDETARKLPEPELRSDRSDEDDSSQLSIGHINLIGLRICQVIKPVTICSLYVALLVSIFDSDVTSSSPNILNKAWRHLSLPTAGIDEGSSSLSSSFVSNIVIVTVFVVLIAVVTVAIVLIFYMEWHACLAYYFYLPSLIIMAILTPSYLRALFKSLNLFAIDCFSLAMFTWNFTVLGMLSIFSLYISTPLCVQQFYLIHNSAILAVTIIQILPGWAPWLLLGLLVLWDTFAVLAPIGPLKLIINMAEREGMVDMPGLVYTTETLQSQQVADDYDSPPRAVKRDNDPINVRRQQDAQKSNSNTSANGGRLNTEQTIESDSSLTGFEANKNVEQQQGKTAEAAKRVEGNRDQGANKETVESRSGVSRGRNIEERGVNIGLGDFIFYGMIVGLTTKNNRECDLYATLATLNAVLVGLVLTLSILVTYRRALPALPISIGLGLVIAGPSLYFAPDLANKLALYQIFI